MPASKPRARASARRPELEAGDRAGAWLVERELGKGGMASVYAVVHTRFGKRAALKLAHRAILGERFTAATFLREARIANLIDHPSVPDVFATGAYDTRPYLVMERLAGQTLGERLAAGPLDRLTATEVLLELCDVLGAAHAAGIVHRDLKLDNVFLVEAPAGARRVKLLDWGLATILAEADPLRGMIAGTLIYVAPEQISGAGVSPASDLYALAVLAYQLLLGRPPFVSTSDLDLIRMHVHDPPPAPEELWPEVPPDLASLLVWMLAKNPLDRPALAEIAGVLERSRARLVRPARSRRASVALARLGATLVIVLALASLGTVLWSALRDWEEIPRRDRRAVIW